ncbi:MAG: hypothetical protein JWM74_4609 [Myxococcaceae bacterium]|jgi:hypothetical protein|nr:hypothetical protein [Myxococcaceae bacterium]
MRQLTRSERILRAACVLALVAIGLMVWSVLDPRPAPVVIAMSLGQVFGTLALAAFLFVVLLDLRAAKLLPGGKPTPPSE